METMEKTTITIEATINAPVPRVWTSWNEPEHITKWCFASDDWHAPSAENDLRAGGKFKTTMAAKDGSFGFDFWGTYDRVIFHKEIEYTIGDGRKVFIEFTPQGDGVHIRQTFEAEATNPVEMQRDGWQAILNNFKKYTEGL